MGLDNFLYDPDHRVVVCRLCGTCLVPKATCWTRHLRAKPHCMRGDELKATTKLLSGYDLRPVEELQQWRPNRARACRPVKGLTTFPGYRCMCDDDGCDYCTRRFAKMHDHMPKHGKKASQHREEAPLWQVCKLQTYFTAKGRIDYFVVEDEQQPSTSSSTAPLALLTPPSSEEGKLFDGLRGDMQKANRDLDEKAAVVQGVGESRADREPWLVYTGFPTHLQGLRDAEIKSSYSLPANNTTMTGHGGAGGGGGRSGVEDPDLPRILVAAETVLRDAYKLCSDRSPDRKMTQQRAKRLGDFAVGTPPKGKEKTAFRSFKNESTLTTYFRKMKQLLAYYYRVVFQEDGHFTQEKIDQAVPQDVIEPTSQQQQAMEGIISALRQQDARGEGPPTEKEDEAECDVKLKHAIRNFYISLVCQTVGSVPFRSPVLSFCAMLSRKVSKQGEKKGKGEDQPHKYYGAWNEPGNFNSNLSAITYPQSV